MILYEKSSKLRAGSSTIDVYLPAALWLLAIAMGAVHTWAAISHHSMNSDGINYLDIGDAYLNGDWTNALSSVWSPMYSWILGLVMALVNPSMALEFPLVHFVDFIIYLAALLCFSFFWRQLSFYRDMRLRSSAKAGKRSLPNWAWLTIGYLLFITVSLTLIEMWAVTPDMLMSAFVYLAAAFLVRIRLQPDKRSNFVLLGLTLGLGFLAKAIMFPVAVLFMGIGLLSGDGLRQNLGRLAICGAVFLLVSAPFILAVSWSKGRLTFGDAGGLTYAKHVNGVQYPHWQGDPQNGIPVHPSRQILEEPPVYEFGTPVAGTYPIGYDPSYWYEGLETPLNLGKQIDYLIISAQYFIDVFFRQLGGLTFMLLLLYLLARIRPSGFSDMVGSWGLALIAIAVLSFYATVNVSGRYIGVFVLLLFADLLANIRLNDKPWRRSLVTPLSVVAVSFMAINLLAFNLSGIREMDLAGAYGQSQEQSARSPDWPGEVAEVLQGMGLEPGDRVGVIGHGFGSFWARLGRFKIVAELMTSDVEAFWVGDQALQASVIEAFSESGAEAIVAEEVPAYTSLPGWQQIHNTNYYVRLLDHR